MKRPMEEPPWTFKGSSFVLLFWVEDGTVSSSSSWGTRKTCAACLFCSRSACCCRSSCCNPNTTLSICGAGRVPAGVIRSGEAGAVLVATLADPEVLADIEGYVGGDWESLEGEVGVPLPEEAVGWITVGSVIVGLIRARTTSDLCAPIFRENSSKRDLMKIKGFKSV